MESLSELQDGEAVTALPSPNLITLVDATLQNITGNRPTTAEITAVRDFAEEIDAAA